MRSMIAATSHTKKPVKTALTTSTSSCLSPSRRSWILQPSCKRVSSRFLVRANESRKLSRVGQPRWWIILSNVRKRHPNSSSTWTASSRNSMATGAPKSSARLWKRLDYHACKSTNGSLTRKKCLEAPIRSILSRKSVTSLKLSDWWATMSCRMDWSYSPFSRLRRSKAQSQASEILKSYKLMPRQVLAIFQKAYVMTSIIGK